MQPTNKVLKESIEHRSVRTHPQGSSVAAPVEAREQPLMGNVCYFTTP
jgi:hypothetical protein